MRKKNLSKFDVQDEIVKHLRAVYLLMDDYYEQGCEYWTACYINNTLMFNDDPDLGDRTRRIDFTARV